MIAIIDYGAGNLKSIQKALEFVGEETVILEEGKNADLDKYAGLVLPGVGAFPGAMKRLKENNFVDFIEKFVVTGRPFLGVCLGVCSKEMLSKWRRTIRFHIWAGISWK